MKLDQLRHFICIAESGSFNKAAKKLYISQPALTASIRSLENELGVTLLFRSNKGIHLTNVGQQVYLDCKDIINLLNEKVDYWKNYSSIAKDSAGVVFFAAIPAICTYLLNNGFFALESVFPKINISLFDVDMLDFPRLLKNSNAKIGLNAVSLRQGEQSQILYQYQKYGFNYKNVPRTNIVLL